MKWKNTFIVTLLLSLVGYIQAQEVRQQTLLLELIQPRNKATVRVPYPMLNWNAFASNQSNLRFDLKLTEKIVGQTAAYALSMNTPLIEIRNWKQSYLNYPSSALALEEGHTYVWQVVVRTHYGQYQQSEIWEFTYEKPKEIEEEEATMSYRFLKPKHNNTYYVMKDIIRFAYDNRNNENMLNYQIQKSGAVVDSRKYQLPTIELLQGVNTIDLEVKGLINGASYVLVIRDALDQAYCLPFIYQK